MSSTAGGAEAVEEDGEGQRRLLMLEMANYGTAAVAAEHKSVVEDESEAGSEPTTVPALSCFLCVCLGVFLGDAGRGLVTPTLVPYLQEAGSSSTFVGWTNALYSVGRLVAAPLFGMWCETRTFQEAQLVNLLLFFVGNLVYVLSEGHRWWILVSRLLVGLGSGTLGLSRGYVAQTTKPKDRSSYMAWLTAAQFIGYSVTPGAGALFSLLDVTVFGGLKLNQFTVPGYVMALGALVNAIMMLTVWKEPRRSENQRMQQHSDNNKGTNWSTTAVFTVALLVVLQFMTRYVVAVYETAGQLIATDVLHWTSLVFGLASCAYGVVGTIVLFMEKPASRFISEHWILVMGLFSLSIGFVVYPPLAVLASHHYALLAQYHLGSLFIFGIGYPITQALLLSLFSKALGTAPQAAVMGMMASLGSAAKVVGALVAGFAFSTNHLGLCFYLSSVILLLSTIGTAHFLKRKAD